MLEDANILDVTEEEKKHISVCQITKHLMLQLEYLKIQKLQ